MRAKFANDRADEAEKEMKEIRADLNLKEAQIKLT